MRRSHAEFEIIDSRFAIGIMIGRYEERAPCLSSNLCEFN
jgi:hypothetical protein